MIYEFTLSANASRVLPGGYSITILESTQQVTVERLSANNGRLEVAENVPASWFWHQAVWSADPVTKGVKVTAGSLGATVKISISDGNSGVNTISGVVSTVNADKQRTEAGQSFIQGGYTANAAANYSMSLLENPSGSGVNFFVNRIIGSVVTGGRIGIHLIDDVAAALADASISFTGSKAMDCKKVGAAAGSLNAVNIRATNNTLVGVSPSTQFDLQAGFPIELDAVEPYMLAPGTGLLMVNKTVNDGITVSWEGYEEEAA